MPSFVSTATIVLAAVASVNAVVIEDVTDQYHSTGVQPVYGSFGPLGQFIMPFTGKSHRPVITIKLGDGAGKPMNMLLDSSTNMTWGRSTLCHRGNNCRWFDDKFPVPSYITLQSLQSNPSKQVRSVTYADGMQVECYNVMTDAVIGGRNVFDHQVCAATYSNAPDRHPIDGVLGIGSRSTPDVTNIMRSMLQGFHPNHQTMSFWFHAGINTMLFEFNRYFGTVDPLTSYTGEVSFGPIDHTKYTGELKWFQHIGDEERWTIPFDGITVGDYMFPVLPLMRRAMVNTGSVLTYLQKDMFDAINANMRALRTESGMYQFECSKVMSLPTVMIVMNGRMFSMPWYQQVILTEDKRCMSAFAPAIDRYGRIVLGTSFLRTVYTTFDFENMRVGFATRSG